MDRRHLASIIEDLAAIGRDIIMQARKTLLWRIKATCGR